MLLLATIACRAGQPSHTVRGTIVDLRAAGLGRAEAVTVRTESGELLELKVADSVQFSAAHLREHLVFAEAVTVTVVDGPAGPTATAITD